MTHVDDRPKLIGRSSSHFTRLARIFAAELEVGHSFQVLGDLLSRDANDYGGNPALKIPVLTSARGAWYGALPICRELARRAQRPLHIVWPEALDTPLVANAQELATQAMATEVALVMSRIGNDGAETAHQGKMRRSLTGSLDWLERHLDDSLAALPARDLSVLEVSLLCLVRHLEFREVLPVAGYAGLQRLCEQLEARPSVATTPFRFDG